MQNVGSEPDRRPPKRNRIIFILLLTILYGILTYTTFIVGPPILTPLSSVPPNRYVEWTKTMHFAAHITGFFRIAYWNIALIFVAGLAFFCWKGWLDSLLKPVIGLTFLCCLAAVGLLWYIQSLPDQVERDHGPEIRRRICGA